MKIYGYLVSVIPILKEVEQKLHHILLLWQQNQNVIPKDKKLGKQRIGNKKVLIENLRCFPVDELHHHSVDKRKIMIRHYLNRLSFFR